MKISMIVCVGENGEIGKDGKLVFFPNGDMKRFKKLTTENIVVMGRKTWESIPEKFRPLPERINIVMSRNKINLPEGVLLAHSIVEVLKKIKWILSNVDSEMEVFCMGGEEIYRLFMPYATKLYMTEVKMDAKADAFFPEFNKKEWKETFREDHFGDEYNYSFVEYEKKN